MSLFDVRAVNPDPVQISDGERPAVEYAEFAPDPPKPRRPRRLSRQWRVWAAVVAVLVVMGVGGMLTRVHTVPGAATANPTVVAQLRTQHQVTETVKNACSEFVADSKFSKQKTDEWGQDALNRGLQNVMLRAFGNQADNVGAAIQPLVSPNMAPGEFAEDVRFVQIALSGYVDSSRAVSVSESAYFDLLNDDARADDDRLHEVMNNASTIFVRYTKIVNRANDQCNEFAEKYSR